MNTSKLKNLIKQSLLEELGSSEKFKSVASDIYDELEKMGSYDSTDVDNKIKEKGYDPNSEEGMNILYYFKKIDFDPGRYKMDESNFDFSRGAYDNILPKDYTEDDKEFAQDVINLLTSRSDFTDIMPQYNVSMLNDKIKDITKGKYSIFDVIKINKPTTNNPVKLSNNIFNLIKKSGEIYDTLKSQGMSDEKAGKIATSKAMSVKEMVQTALAEKKKSFPDLTGDGKVTKADILKGRGVEMKEDLDIGHQDDEPDMLKADVYRIAEYAVALYKMLDKFDKMEGEVDFPDWWQQKIHIAAEYMDKAKHYLEFEMNQPAVDKMADVASEIDLEMVAEAFNPSDKITMDVPLFLRMLEYAKEDAKTDMDLHVVTEKAVELSSEGKTLSMSDYDAITKDEIKTKAVSDLAESVAKKVKEARFKKGTDIGEPGKGFEKIAKSAGKKYGSEEAGKRVAGAVLKKILAKK